MSQSRVAWSARADGGRSLRVLRIIARLNIGGPARHTVILNEGLQRLGYETLLVYGAVGAREGSFERLAADRSLASLSIPHLGRRIKAFDDVRAFAQILRLLYRWRPDIVHTHTAKAGTLGRLAALAYNATRFRRQRCAVVHTFHGHVFSGYFGPVGSAAVQWIERILARFTDCIVTISNRQREDIVSRFRIARADQTVMVPLGLELSDLVSRTMKQRGIRARLGFDASDFVVGYVGRLVPIKDLGTLIESLALMRGARPHVRLVVVGDGEQRKQMERAVRSRNLHDAVRFLGWRDDLAAIYSALDVFVISSLNEGTPVSLIEAMAAGVPVVATAVGGVPDVVRDEVTGLLCPAGDPTALACAMTRVADDVESARARARAAREFVASQFDASRLVRDVDGLYFRVLAGKRELKKP